MDRHLILTLGRSGSNTLANLLNQHSEILNMGEVLGNWNRVRQIKDTLHLYPDNISGYLDAVSQPSLLFRTMVGARNVARLAKLNTHEIKPLAQARTVGFKEFATLFHNEQANTWLMNRPNVKVIGLIRDNILDRLVSWLMMKKTGVVLKRHPTNNARQTLEIDPDEIQGFLQIIDDENKLLERMLSSLPTERVYTLHYSDFYRDEPTRQRLLNEVCQFLSVGPFSPVIRMEKIMTHAPAETIANRAECAARLRGTRFQGILD